MATAAVAIAQRRALLEDELARIVDVLVREYRPSRIILFGSLAQGTIHEWSDIDLALIKETERRFIDRIGDVLDLVRSPVGLEVVVYTPREMQEMVAQGNYFVVEEILGKGRTLFGPIG